MNLAAAIAQKSIAYAQRLAQSTSEGSMNSRVVIRRPGLPGFNPVTREYDPAVPAVIYDHESIPGAGGVAGITPAQGASYMDVGDEPQYYDSASVMIPQSAPRNPMINDIVQVVASPDADIVGRFFRVVGVPVGGRIVGSIAMSCTGIAPSREWVST